MDHFVLESSTSFPGPNAVTPVQVFRHKATDMRFVFVSIPGPQATATIVVPTVVSDSRGLPHTLEHLVFCGSKNYPTRGYLDSLANRCLSTGTNAYTTEDHTGYTIATAGRDGMAEILPVFIDHVLHPTLRDDQFVTEVYHVDGTGKQQGVVFSEMAARENSEADLLDLGLRKLLYPSTQTYFHECGGLTAEIPKLTNKDIQAYHEKFYHPSNLTIVVAGDGLQPDLIFERLMQHHTLPSIPIPESEKINIIKDMDISLGRGDAPIMNTKPSQLTTRTIRFPSAEEDVGSIGYGWIGPNTYDVKTMVALDILFRFLHETSASPFSQAFVERRNPLASHVDFEVKGAMDTSLLLLFSGIAVVPEKKTKKENSKENEDEGDMEEENESDESGDEEEADEDEDEENDSDDEEDEEDEEDEDEDEEEEEESEMDDEDDKDETIGSEKENGDLFEAGRFHKLVQKVLAEFVQNGLSDPSEMSRIIARHRTKINEAIEDDPHEAATSYLIPDILAHAYLEKDKTKPASIGTRSNIFAIIDELEKMDSQFWRDLARVWLLEPAMVEVMMIPDSKLGKKIKATVVQKQAELVESFGAKGLETQGKMVAEAVEANRVNLTPEIIAKMPAVADPAKVPTTPMTVKYDNINGGVGDYVERPFDVVQVAETNTFFTHLKLCLPLTHLDEELRPYLVLFQELLFQSACSIPSRADSGELVFEHLDYKTVVTLVSNTLVSHEAAVGFGNDIFACSWLSELFVMACSAERSKYREQCQLLLRVLMFSNFRKDRVLTIAKNLLTQTVELKRDGGDLLGVVSTRMTTPVRGYELSTKYCKKAQSVLTRSTSGQSGLTLESPTPVLGNDIAICAFRQEPFLKRIIKELKQESEFVPRILSNLERIKRAMLESVSETVQNAKLNGNTPAAGFAQVGIPIGYGSTTSGEQDPVQVLAQVWAQEHALYKESVEAATIESTSGTPNSRKRKPSASFESAPDRLGLKCSIQATLNKSLAISNDITADSKLSPFPFPRTPYRALENASEATDAPSSVLIPMKSITSSYLVSIVPCDIVYHPHQASDQDHRDQFATMLLCEILSRSEGPLYSAIRGNGYAYDASISVYLWTGQMAFEIRDAMDPVKAYDAFLDLIRLMDTDWEKAVGGQFEFETARSSRAYQTCMERATAGGCLSWILRGSVRGFEILSELEQYNHYLYTLTVDDLKRVYHKFFKQFLDGRQGQGLTTVLLTPPAPSESIKTHFGKYGIDFQEASLTDFEIEPTFDFVAGGDGNSSGNGSPASAVSSAVNTPQSVQSPIMSGRSTPRMV